MKVAILFFTEKSTAVQLRGSSSAKGRGRVEIHYKGQWGTICNDLWDINDAKVACRNLGYNYTTKVVRSYNVPQSTGHTWLANVTCNGSEQSLSSCRHGEWGRNNCSYYGDAGVECHTTGGEIIPLLEKRQ